MKISKTNIGTGVKNNRAGKFAAVALAAASAITFASTASATTPVTITDKNSSLTVDYSPNTLPTAPNGINNWTVDGTNVLSKEWFWDSVGSSGAPTSINNFTPSTPVVTNILGDGSNNNYAQLNFVDPNNPLSVQVDMALVGGATGSKASDLAETIMITNTGSSTLNYNFYLYSDFSLGGASGGETATVTGGNTAKVTKPGALQMSETVASPVPSFFETAAAPSLLNALDSSSHLTLNDVATTTTTSGDAEWGFEWSMQLKPGGSYVISVDKQISATAVPEPATGVATLGVTGWLLTRRRRRNAAR